MTTTPSDAHNQAVSLYISRSTTTSRVNQTGSWRFARPRYQDKTAPCSAACPAGVDIPRVERAVAEGRVDQAWHTYMTENPFPAVCGRVCFHTCELACNRSRLDQPVSINRLDRFVGDAALDKKFSRIPDVLPSNGRKVAIVGSGPAGLSAAYFLIRLGFTCEIFESKSQPGGVLHWGIPAYRLPKTILHKELGRIVDMGVRIHCNRSVDADFLARLQASNDAVFLGCGLGRPVSPGIPGSRYMADGLALLEAIQNGAPPDVKGEVAVIGGGNTAIDVARSLIRLGALPVILYRRRRQDMPAFEHEIEAAQAEGVRIAELVAPLTVEPSGNGVCVHLSGMKIAEAGDDGRPRVVPDGVRTTTLHFSAVYSGIGADVADDWHRPGNGQGANRMHLSHSVFDFSDTPLVYGGDPVMPVKSVTDAIAAGKQAAMALHAWFEGGSDAVSAAMDHSRVGPGPTLSLEIYLGGQRRLRDRHLVAPEEINTDYFQKKERGCVPGLTMEKARTTFDEIDATLPPDRAAEEAGRCYQCGLCNDCDNCRIFCAEVSIDMVDGKRRIDLDYCKGCGVCVAECPRNAMIIEEERA